MSSISKKMMQAAAGAGGIARIVATDSVVSGNRSADASFSSVSFGSLPAANEKRFLVIADSGSAGFTNQDISSTITVAGNSATIAVSKLATSTSFKQWAAVYYIEDNTNTSGTIAFNSNGFNRSYGFQVYAVYIQGTQSFSVYSQDTDEASTSLSVSLNTPNTLSFMVSVASFRNGATPPTVTFGGTAGISTDLQADTSGSNETGYIGSKPFSSANTGLTVTATDATANGTESVMCGVVMRTAATNSALALDYLVVGGGGGGGGSLGDFVTATGGGGGGGAGGVVSGSTYAYTEASYTITVGNGGAGGTGRAQGSDGETSSFDSIASAAGGGGGAADNAGGSNGACGGGAGGTSTSATGGTGSLGFDGGDSLTGTNNNGAGGGGMGAAGQDGGTTAGNFGDGGDGITSSITGSSVYYGGGGGGGEGADGTNDQGDGGLGGGGAGGRVNRAPNDAVAGTANTGGGGGGGADDTGTEKNGAAGGSGVVILRSLETAASTTGSPTVTTDGSYTIYTFTASGSITY